MPGRGPSSAPGQRFGLLGEVAVEVQGDAAPAGADDAGVPAVAASGELDAVAADPPRVGPRCRRFPGGDGFLSGRPHRPAVWTR